MRPLILAAVIVAMVAVQGNTQMSPKVLVSNMATAARETQQLASQSLATFSKLVNEKNVRQMGFDSADELRSVSLGAALLVYYVRLDRLREYTPGSDPYRLLEGGERVIYPVLVRAQVRSGISVEKVKGEWKATSFGSPQLTRLLSRIRAENSAATKSPPAAYFAVQVLALNQYFLGREQEGKLTLIPVLDDPAFEFKAGGGAAADTVFARLVPAAKAHDGLPR